MHHLSFKFYIKGIDNIKIYRTCTTEFKVYTQVFKNVLLDPWNNDSILRIRESFMGYTCMLCIHRLAQFHCYLLGNQLLFLYIRPHLLTQIISNKWGICISINEMCHTYTTGTSYHKIFQRWETAVDILIRKVQTCHLQIFKIVPVLISQVFVNKFRSPYTLLFH